MTETSNNNTSNSRSAYEQALYTFIYETVASEGGDGDMVVSCSMQDCFVMADGFEKFLLEQGHPYCRKDTSGSAVLWNDQESWTFTNNLDYDSIPRCTQYMRIV